MLPMDFSALWKNETWIGFDIETSGSYPFRAEICEVAAVKYRQGQVVDRFLSFAKISKPMP